MGHALIEFGGQIIGRRLRHLELHHLLVVNAEVAFLNLVGRLLSEVEHLLAELGADRDRGAVEVELKGNKAAVLRSVLFNRVIILSARNSRHLVLPLIVHSHLLLADSSQKGRLGHQSVCDFLEGLVLLVRVSRVA